MLFNSIVFIIFAIFFFAFWPIAKKKRNLRWGYLIVTSFIFYGWWDWRFLLLIIATGLLDFCAALGMEVYQRRKRLFLVVSILGNIGSLAIFKYSGFIADNLDNVFALLGYDLHIKPHIPHFMLVLPLGISFYTFHSMSYTIDVYRERIRPTRHILHYFAYLSMFPQIVAGPIIRARDLLPQLLAVPHTTEHGRWTGLQLIAQGYFKKMVIADNLAPIVTGAFSATVLSDSTIYWWFIMTAFASQIYCDFSGYTDIARGLAKWIGYDYALNFNHPYISTTMREFWTRWHMSLSSWFRDYVYISLGGSRAGKLRSHINMWITMLISGLWHGAAWHFVMWGAINAFYLSIERISKWPSLFKKLTFGRGITQIAVIIQVWVAWVFFRADTIAQALHIIKTMFSITGTSHAQLAPDGMIYCAIVILMELYNYFQLDWKYIVSPAWQKVFSPIVWALIIAACIYLRGPGSQFIYFQF